MKINKTALHIFRYILLLLIPVLHAAGLEFTAIEYGASNSSEPIFYHDGKEYKEIKLRNQRRSLTCRAELGEDRVLRMFSKNPSQEPNAIPYLVIGSVTVDSGYERVLLLINRIGNDGANQLRLRLIEESVASFPRGSYRFINLSGRKIGILFGEEKVLIEDDEMKTLKANPKNDEGNYVQVQLVGQTGYLYQSTWYIGRFSRELVFLLPDEEDEGVRLIMFSQNVTD